MENKGFRVVILREVERANKDSRNFHDTRAADPGAGRSGLGAKLRAAMQKKPRKRRRAPKPVTDVEGEAHIEGERE